MTGLNLPALKGKTLQTGIFPGVIMIAVIVIARLAGILQGLEWIMLDYGLRLRPAEAPDDRIVVVGINEADIQRVGQYPIPDQHIATLLTTLQDYQPRVIGLDIFRDLPVEPGHQALTDALGNMPNVIGIEKALPGLDSAIVKPPPHLPQTQIGFADVLLDQDRFVRRSLLGTSNPDGDYRFSLTVRLAAAYLAAQGIALENGIQDPVAMRFGSTELSRFHPNMGGYVRTDAGGNQILINFRSGSQPFQIVSMGDIEAGTVDPHWFRDRIIIIGVRSLSQKDLVNSAAVSGSNSGLIYGVELQAHAISQILSAVLDDRPLLTTWPDAWEYLWIIAWGLLGLGLGQWIRSPMTNYLIVITLSLGLIGLAYTGLILGVWLPLFPTLLVFGLNGLVLYGFYVYDRSLRERIADRQQVIERTFDTIHNGPLQTLAGILRHTQDQDGAAKQLTPRLHQLNAELRDVYEAIRQETLNQGSQFFVIGDRVLDLHLPLHEVLYEVYTHTIQRDFPGFEHLKVKIIDFVPLGHQHLTLELRRCLCRFLEEALCNVGKHAIGATQLTVICKQEGNQNLIRVIDNGVGLATHTDKDLLIPSGNRGTQQARKLAQRVQGKFERNSASSNGVICQLTWPVNRSWLKKS